MNPSKTSLHQRLGRLRGGAVHRFSAASSGMAAVAFALIAPIMIMADAFTALNAIMYPFPPNSMKIRISSLIDNGNGTVKVAWSDAQNMDERSVDEVVSIPEGLVATGGSVIMSEVIYTYNSPAPHFFPAPVPMTDTYYLHPRKATQITRQVACT